MMEWWMSWKTMFVVLDIAGIIVCTLIVVMLYRKHKKNAHPSVLQKNLRMSRDHGEYPRSEAGFDRVFANVLAYPAQPGAKENKNGKIDPYEEARWLAELGMSINGIAERVDLPRCEIELIIDLCRVRSSSVNKGRKLAEVF
ncbi:DUF2802 domain-containing protein [Desulfatirhabdium butyrativorans]|uniref:DUF2802 domain-containing protein n=1 Tax=Desulfatirhabdium butyrativorans TaxID=340467 RepID=UPI00042A4378|nr:DUF2802 domain-containing protein [Desulfatirhabdium butyrativorans]